MMYFKKTWLQLPQSNSTAQPGSSRCGTACRDHSGRARPGARDVIVEPLCEHPVSEESWWQPGIEMPVTFCGGSRCSSRSTRQGPDGNIYFAVERNLQFGPGSARLTPNGSIFVDRACGLRPMDLAGRCLRA
jgi:hypothetical protein